MHTPTARQGPGNQAPRFSDQTMQAPTVCFIASCKWQGMGPLTLSTVIWTLGAMPATPSRNEHTFTHIQAKLASQASNH